MPPGRNDPCPCGSGRKYKLCCQSADAVRAAESAAAADPKRATRPAPHRPDILEAIRAQPEWAADAFGMPIAVADGHSPRPVAVLVTAGDLVVHSDTLGSLRGGAAPVAAALEQALTNAARSTGGWPERVVVRHHDVATELATRLQGREVTTSVGEVPGLVAAATSLMEHMAGRSMWPTASSTERWRGWELPARVVADIFDAAADFYQAMPWEVLDNFQAPRALLPSGRAWTCCVMGAGGEEFGLVLYGDASDLYDTVANRHGAVGLDGMRGPVLSLTFDPLAEVPPTAAYEVRTNRWKLAGPAAYPRLFTINTPGGAVSEQDAQDLVLLLRAVPAWADAHEDALLDESDTGEPMRATRWTHPATGVVLEYAGEGAGLDVVEDDDVAPDDASLPPEIHQQFHDVVEQVRRELGPHAPQDRFIEEVNRRLAPVMMAMNSQPREEFGGRSSEEVRALLAADWNDPAGPVRLNRDLADDDVAAAPFVANARLLLAAGLETGSIPATSSGNLKPALLEALLPRMQWVDEHEAEYALKNHKRVQETDYRELHRLRVVCEQTGLLMRRSTRFDLAPDAHRLALPEHGGELFVRLFIAWFREFNLEYGTRYDWPALQHQVAYTIQRVGEVAGEWMTADELADDVVLPFALREFFEHHQRSSPYGALQFLVLDALAGFGLLERRVDGYGSVDYDVRYRAAPLLSRFFPRA